MRSLFLKSFFVLSCLSLIMAGTASAQGAVTRAGFESTVCRGKIVPINSVSGGGVLYKPANLHGGRGPSFLVQNVSQRTNKQVLQIRNAKCEVIATIGLFKTDQPYGSRYYSATGGSGYSDQQLYNLARQVGSSNILFEGVNGTWIRVKNPLNREGSVRK